MGARAAAAHLSAPPRAPTPVHLVELARPARRALTTLLCVLCTLAAAAPPAAGQDDGIAALERDLRRLVRAAGPAASYGVLVVSLERGDTLFSHDADVPLTPASNMKLYSTAAALFYLGPAFRFQTYVLAEGEVRDGVLHGDLVLYGTGDPSIGRGAPTAQPTFRALADSLRARGIHHVAGDVVGDGSYFDDRWIAGGWTSYDRSAWYAPPVGALSFGENRVALRIRPGASAGAPARLSTEPATEGLAVVNRVRTVSRGETRIALRHGAEALVVEGQIRSGHGGLRREIPVVDPANYAAAALGAALRERGIRVSGGTRSRYAAPAAPAGAGSRRVLAIHASAPLHEISSVTNHVSHNLFAESLHKAAGRALVGEGSFDAGARVILRFLADEVGADTARLRVLDGSGLSAGNRLTARATVQLLEFMARSELAAAFQGSLPSAGSAQGLRRMFGTPAAANLRAKTGTLRGVSSLSGYVRSADGEQLAFSIIANGVAERARAKATEDAVGRRLAAFRRGEPNLAAGLRR